MPVRWLLNPAIAFAAPPAACNSLHAKPNGAGTPLAVVARVNTELNALLKQSEIRDLLAKQGMAPAGGTPERFGDLVKKELARWSRVVAAAGIKAD